MREQLLDAAERMVQDRGLNAVSFQQLADAVGLSKPSVFHHFRTKEALTQALIERCQTLYRAQYDAIIAEDLPAPAKLRGIAELFETGLRGDRLCLLASIGTSASTVSEPVRDELRLTVTTTVDRFARVFEQGRREGSLSFEGAPEDAAAGFLALLQGLQVLSRAKREAAAFSRAAETYIDSITT